MASIEKHWVNILYEWETEMNFPPKTENKARMSVSTTLFIITLEVLDSIVMKKTICKRQTNLKWVYEISWFAGNVIAYTENSKCVQKILLDILSTAELQDKKNKNQHAKNPLLYFYMLINC